MSENLRNSRDDFGQNGFSFIPSPKAHVPESPTNSETKTPRKTLQKSKESLFTRKLLLAGQEKPAETGSREKQQEQFEPKKTKKKLQIKLDFFKEKMELRQQKATLSTLISKKPSELILKNFEIFDNLIKKKQFSKGPSEKKTERVRPDPRDSACLLKMSRSDSFLQVEKEEQEIDLRSTDRAKVN